MARGPEGGARRRRRHVELEAGVLAELRAGAKPFDPQVQTALPGELVCNRAGTVLVTRLALRSPWAASAGSTKEIASSMSAPIARMWHASIAIVVLIALVLQFWVAAGAPGAPAAHAVGTLAGTPLAGRFLRVLSFFTIQSNILSLIVSAQLARNPNRNGPVWRAVRLASLVGIVITGIIYATVLAKVHEPHGWKETVSNTAFHYVVPIMMLVGWLLYGPRPRIELVTLARSLIYPLAWVIYSLIDGAITGWYPYPFVDVNTLGYAAVLRNSVIVVIVLAVVTALYWLGDRRLPPSHVPPSPTAATAAR
jgi:hypothetical protein